MSNIRLDRGHSGQSVEVSPGDEIEIRLPENPTTGYRWEIDHAAAIVTLAASEYQAAAASAVGGGGCRTFRFTASARGVDKLQLKLVRAWDRQTAVDQFKVILEIK